MLVNCTSYQMFGSGSGAHYSRIHTPDGRVLKLAQAAKEQLIFRGPKVSAMENGFLEDVDQHIFALVEGLLVSQHDWSEPGSSYDSDPVALPVDPAMLPQLRPLKPPPPSPNHGAPWLRGRTPIVMEYASWVPIGPTPTGIAPQEDTGMVFYVCSRTNAQCWREAADPRSDGHALDEAGFNTGKYVDASRFTPRDVIDRWADEIVAQGRHLIDRVSWWDLHWSEPSPEDEAAAIQRAVERAELAGAAR